MIIFFHPFTTFFLVTNFLIFSFLLAIYSKNFRQYLFRKTPLLLALIILFIFFAWYTNFGVFERITNGIYIWLTGRSKISYFDTVTKTVAKAKLTVYEYLNLLFKMHGHHFIYLILSALVILNILKKVFTNRKSLRIEEIFFTTL